MGGDLGAWAIRNVNLDDVGLVFAGDDGVREACELLGIGERLRGQVDPGLDRRATAISVHYPVILTGDQIRCFDLLCNLHPGYLPWGRGYYPIFWALWEGTPAGCTLHEIVEGVDEGPIIHQSRVLYSECDTGGSLFAKVRAAERKLFAQAWEEAVAGRLVRGAVQEGPGTYHTRKEFLDLKRCPDWEAKSGEELVRLIRCLTFPGHPGLELDVGGSLFELSLRSLSDERQHD